MMLPSICGEWCQLLTASLSERSDTKELLFNRARPLVAGRWPNDYPPERWRDRDLSLVLPFKMVKSGFDTTFGLIRDGSNS